MRWSKGGRPPWYPSPLPTRYVDGTTGSRSLNYWKSKKLASLETVKAFLDRKGYIQHDAATQHDLQELYVRAQRGLLCYQRLNHDELHNACIARGLKCSTKRQMILTLQQADDHMTFARFQDLPPEIRVLIYDLHLQSLDCDNALPTQPPITRVSRLIRQESLSLFYDSHLFKIHCGCRGISRFYRRFFQTLPTPAPMRFQRTRLVLTTDVPLDKVHCESRKYVFRYKAGEHTWLMRAGVENEPLETARPSKELGAKLDEFVETLRSRSTGLRLEFEDLEQLERVCEML